VFIQISKTFGLETGRVEVGAPDEFVYQRLPRVPAGPKSRSTEIEAGPPSTVCHIIP
jgi:hypothetical protein